MKKVCAALTLVTAAVCGSFAFATIHNLAIGPSVPASDAKFNITAQDTTAISGGAPTRISGGEVFDFRFVDAKTKKPTSVSLNQVRFIAYSSSGQGKILVRVASGAPTSAAAALKPLYVYSDVGSGTDGTDYQGLVMLANGESVAVAPAKPLLFSQLALDFEAFGSGDASVVVQIDSSAGPGAIAFEMVREIAAKVAGNSGGGNNGGGSSGSSGSSGNDNNPPPVSNPGGELCPDGHYHSGCDLCPNGSYSASCNLCPDGQYHDGCDLCPDGRYSGACNLCPDGQYHSSCGICPDGTWGC